MSRFAAPPAVDADVPHIRIDGEGKDDPNRRLQSRIYSEITQPVPAYLEKVYWWAYVRPWAIRFFERQWLTNAILFGNYVKLRDRALDLLGAQLPGRTLQIACVYGDMTNRLLNRVEAGRGSLDVVDVVPGQIDNLKQKTPVGAVMRTFCMDSADLHLPDAHYDRAVLFFLLHEQPEEWRRKTLSETLRVVRPGGRVVIVDYARPERWSPFRYLLPLPLGFLEPFALDLWRGELRSFLPPDASIRSLTRQSFFGGLYQAVVLEL